MLKGIVTKLGCKSFTVVGSNNRIINCWAYTNENIVYLLKVDATVSSDGDLSLNNIYRNFYNTGTEQFITGCVITDQFIVCSSDNLSSLKPKERTSVIVFRIYNATTRKDYFEYAKLKPADLKDVIPFINTLSFDKTVGRVLADSLDEREYWEQRGRFLKHDRKLAQRMLQADFVQQTFSIYGASSEGVKRHSFKVSPTAISTKAADLSKTNAEDMKNIQVVVTGADGKTFTYKLGDLKADSKPDPVVPDDQKDKPDPPPSNKTEEKKGGIGFFGWFLILLLIGGLVAGVWWFVRREQLKSEAREKMVEDSPELENYE